MKTKKATAVETFKINLAFMMSHKKLTIEGIGRIPGANISARYLRNLINEDERQPTLEKIAALAKIFDLAPWEFIRPDLPGEYMAGNNLKQLIDDYYSADDDGRKMLEVSGALAAKKPKAK